jgi:DNA invertase Pin-like site-specific DNA recombinase
METAVAYYRYSPGGRQGEQSIEGQAAEAHRWASENNVQIVREYADRKISGRSDDRAEFQQMLRELDKIRPTYLILWKLDRFGRNREEIAFNKHKVKKAGAKLVYVAEAIPDTPEGVILESVMEGMAEYYSLQLSQNIRRGQKVAASKCLALGGHGIIGYRAGKDKQYEIDPETAPVVKEIFQRYVAGESQAQIVRWLNASGRRTSRNAPFTVNSIRTLLKNEKYTGIYIWKNEVRIEGGMPAIIDHETWEKAQKRMITNKAAPARKDVKMDFMLTGKLFCGHCGGPMSGVSGTSRNGVPHYYYTCSMKHKKSGGNGCKKKNVRKDWIEGLVLRHIRYLLEKEGFLEAIADKCYAVYAAERDDTSYVDSLRADLRDVQTSLSNLLKAIEAGIFSKTTAARMEELEAQKQQLEDEIKLSEVGSKLALTRDHILYFLLKFRDLDLNEPKSRQRLFDTFVNSIFVYDDKVVITFNYSGDDRQITLKELDTVADESFVSPALSSTITRRDEHYIIVVQNVFAIIAKAEG